MNKNHVARSKVKVTVCTYTLCIDFSEICLCPTHNFVMHNGICKQFGTNDHFDKKMCHEQEP